MEIIILGIGAYYKDKLDIREFVENFKDEHLTK